MEPLSLPCSPTYNKFPTFAKPVASASPGHICWPWLPQPWRRARQRRWHDCLGGQACCPLDHGFAAGVSPDSHAATWRRLVAHIDIAALEQQVAAHNQDLSAVAVKAIGVV